MKTSVKQAPILCKDYKIRPAIRGGVTGWKDFGEIKKWAKTKKYQYATIKNQIVLITGKVICVYSQQPKQTLAEDIHNGLADASKGKVRLR